MSRRGLIFIIYLLFLSIFFFALLVFNRNHYNYNFLAGNVLKWKKLTCSIIAEQSYQCSRTVTELRFFDRRSVYLSINIYIYIVVWCIGISIYRGCYQADMEIKRFQNILFVSRLFFRRASSRVTTVYAYFIIVTAISAYEHDYVPLMTNKLGINFNEHVSLSAIVKCTYLT